MAQTVRWQSICSKCGKGGPSCTKSSSDGQPRQAPPQIGGKCPSSNDGSHKPKWVKVG